MAAREFISYAVKQGVELQFALRMLSYSNQDMWYPTVSELMESGVLVGKMDP